MSRLAVAVLALFAFVIPARAALTGDDLVLVVNANVPASRELAEFYAATRGVPEGRIVEIDVPDQTTLPRPMYDERVVPALRDALDGLPGVECLVTFHGVPLKVAGRQISADEELEKLGIDAQADEAEADLRAAIDRAAQTAALLGRPVPGADALPFGSPLQKSLQRLAYAERAIGQASAGLTEEERGILARTAASLREMLAARPDPRAAELDDAERAELARLAAERGGGRDARERARARELAARASGLDLARVLGAQQTYLDPSQSGAAFDSELAGLFRDAPPLARWLPNPLRGRLDFDRRPRPLMVARLDGLTPQDVRDLIAEAVVTERDGLDGKVVVDSRGLSLPPPGGKPDGYAPFDEQLRQLARYLAERGTLEVVHDDESGIITAVDGRPAIEGVALYVGWYRLRKYEPALAFVPGAVGYHVASFEMKSLRQAGETGWAAGLLRDGVAATLGPVDEPYLSAFPPPGAFFPLLMTGELTLAEVYWATVPQTSWQMAIVGDPLYRPFAARPALDRGSLPPNLRAVLDAAAR